MTRKRQQWFLCIVLILLVGCQPKEQNNNTVTVFENILQVENIQDYLVRNIGISAFRGKVFCVYEPLDAEQGAEGKIYLWALCQEYYLKQEVLKIGSGASLPVALQVREENGHYEIIDHTVPQDGAYYRPDVRIIFPRSTWSQIMPQGEEEISQYNDRASELEEETEMQARLYYGILMP